MYRSKKLWYATIVAAALGAMLVLAMPEATRADESCAPYISGGPNNPRTGTLRGTRTVSMTFTVGVGGSGVSYTITFTVGIYDMDGEDKHLAVRCDTYTEWVAPVPT